VLTLRLFGDLEVEVDGRARPALDRRPGSLLLAWMALHPGLHARGDVAAALWPDVLGDSARGSLRSALASVRRGLGPAARDHVVAGRFTLGLALDVRVDVLEFERLVAEAAYDEALALCRGPLLQQFDEDWVVRLREHYRGREGEALGAAATAAEAAGDLRRGVAVSRRWVALEPLNEPVARDLIRRLADAGDRAGAMAAYNALAERLHGELRVAPSAQTRRLVASIRRTSAAEPRPHLPLPASLHERRPLIGRDEELEELRAARASRVVLVSGEAGIGKTRLLAAVASSAHAGGAQVLAAVCRAGGDVAFAPVAAALRQAIGEDVDALAAVPGVAPLTALLPELAGDAPPEGDPSRLHAAVRAALRWVAGGRGVLLVVDDLHWADASTLRLLDDLAEGAPGLDLALVAAHRPLADETAAAQVTRRWRRRPDALSLDLEGLGEDAVAALAEVRVGERPPHRVARALHRRTGGHPLFVAELADRFGTPWPSAAEIARAELPASVADVVGERLDALEPAARRALSVGAAVGDQFPFALVATVLGDEEGTLDVLDQAVRGALLREEGPGRYAFAHAIVREAAYARLTATRRAHLHRRIAEALEEPAPDATRVRRLAEHHLRAAELGDRERAAHFALLAAEQAVGRRAPEEGAVLLERALEALPDDLGPARRAALLVRLGHARRRAGEGETVRDAFIAAAHAARAAGDAVLLAEAALGICSVPWFPGKASEDAVATDALREALGRLDQGDEAAPLRARVHAQLVREEYFTTGPEEARRRADVALEQARATGDPTACALALETWLLAQAGAARPAARRTRADDLVELAVRADDPELELRARVWRAVAALQLGDADAALAEETAIEAMAAELRRPAWRWWPALWRAMRAIRGGDLERGEQLAWAAWEIGERPLGERAALELQAQLFWVRWRQGRLEELAAAAEAMCERYVHLVPAWRCVDALVEAERGREAQARAALRELARDGFAALPADVNRLVGLVVAAHACLALDARDVAPALVEALRPHRDEWPVSGYGGLVMEPVADTLRALDSAGVPAV
jgi:DNA-binding SARP family transcriptional activator